MVYNDAITIYSNTSHNEYGEKDFGTGISSKARVVLENSEILNANGERVQTDATIHIPLDKEDYASVGSKIVHDSIDYVVVGSKKIKNEVGQIRDIKLLCKRYG